MKLTPSQFRLIEEAWCTCVDSYDFNWFFSTYVDAPDRDAMVCEGALVQREGIWSITDAGRAAYQAFTH